MFDRHVEYSALNDEQSGNEQNKLYSQSPNIFELKPVFYVEYEHILRVMEI